MDDWIHAMDFTGSRHLSPSKPRALRKGLQGERTSLSPPFVPPAWGCKGASKAFPLALAFGVSTNNAEKKDAVLSDKSCKSGR